MFEHIGSQVAHVKSSGPCEFEASSLEGSVSHLCRETWTLLSAVKQEWKAIRSFHERQHALVWVFRHEDLKKRKHGRTRCGRWCKNTMKAPWESYASVSASVGRNLSPSLKAGTMIESDFVAASSREGTLTCNSQSVIAVIKSSAWWMQWTFFESLQMGSDRLNLLILCNQWNHICVLQKSTQTRIRRWPLSCDLQISHGLCKCVWYQSHQELWWRRHLISG